MSPRWGSRERPLTPAESQIVMTRSIASRAGDGDGDVAAVWEDVFAEFYGDRFEREMGQQGGCDVVGEGFEEFPRAVCGEGADMAGDGVVVDGGGDFVGDVFEAEDRCEGEVCGDGLPRGALGIRDPDAGGEAEAVDADGVVHIRG